MPKVKVLIAAWTKWDGKSDCAPDFPSDFELEAAKPVGAELRFLQPGEELRDQIEDVDVLYGPILEPDLVRAAKLKWVQLNSTGADVMMYDAFVKRDIALTTLGGAITVTVAEHALALLLALARNLHRQRDSQRERRWAPVAGIELDGITLGILGFGRIGRAIAQRARAFGMRILAVDAIPRDKPDYVDELQGLGALPTLLSRMQALICTVPKTPGTLRMIGEAELRLLPRGALVINVGRGGVIEETALLRALRSGALAGAALDVTETEPLSPSSPLWVEPDLLLTPHSAGFCHDLRQKKVRWFVNNLERYLRHEPLFGQVDPRRGF